MYMQNSQGEAKSAHWFTVSLTPAATAAASCVEQAFTVTAGNNSSTLRAGYLPKATDLVFVSPPTNATSTGVAGARINATGQLVIKFINPTAGSLTHAAGTFGVWVVRP